MKKIEINEEKANKFVSNLIEEIKIRDKKRKEMFSNTNYLKWLEIFTIKYESFTDNSWLYQPEELSQEENENVAKLSLLYDGIELYAKKNYIYPNKCDFGNYYNMKLDNVGYKIAMLIGQGTVFACTRTELDKNIEYIDFNDIINDKKQDNVDFIKQQLKELSDKVVQLHSKGISLEAIIDSLESTLTEIKEEKKTTKTLKR